MDGMTRFFTPIGDRKRSAAVYATPIRRRKDTDKSMSNTAAEESDAMGLTSDGGAKSDGKICIHV